MTINPKSVAAIAAAHGVDPVALAAALDAEFCARADARLRAREEAAEHNARSGSVAGPYRRRQRRPKSDAGDRAYVPGALRNWRLATGLSVREAAVRIGSPPNGSAWKSWEAGTYAPSYRTLLTILASTGMKPWIHETAPAYPGETLDLAAAQAREVRRVRRQAAVGAAIRRSGRPAT